MTAQPQADLARFCSTCARNLGLDAAGSAYSYEHLVAVEVPLPWPMAMYSEPGVLPQELLDFRDVQIRAYQEGTPLYRTSLAIAPDPAYSLPGYRRVLSYRRPTGMFARFEQHEYIVPEGEAGALAWALLLNHTALPRYADFEQAPSTTRDLMVCTHGAVDAACAKFGFPLYRRLRRMADDSGGRFRVWRVSHFGGHVFAPTLIDMPEFRYWGYADHDLAERIALRMGGTALVRDCLRGWAGFDDPMLQTAERELFVRRGWDWLDYEKRGTVLAQDPTTGGVEPRWADAEIAWRSPDGSERGRYIVKVVLDKHIETFHTTGDPGTYPYPQYIVTHLERVE
jgi:hypothetical protein